jgi:hypothetical protein
MLVRHSANARIVARNASVAELLAGVSAQELRAWVEQFSVPRHFEYQHKMNRKVAEQIAALFTEWGYEVAFEGEFYNVVARPPGLKGRRQIVAAHFDSTSATPGADDNASAVAAMLGCAKVMAGATPTIPVTFISFNREEDGLLGSQEYVAALGKHERAEIECAHVLEMVGFCTNTPGSQRMPANLPIKAPTVGNFLGLLANGDSGGPMNRILQQAKAHVPELPTLGLHVRLGLEQALPVLQRSDHAPFWHAGIPSVMWTDTSEFRNPHYHMQSDTPETLNYDFLRRVTQLLVATVMAAK